MTASPPTTAKSTPLRARSANSFSNWEIVRFGSGEGFMSEFADKGEQVFDANKPLAGRRRTANGFPNRLLQRLCLVTHAANYAPSPLAVNQRLPRAFVSLLR